MKSEKKGSQKGETKAGMLAKNSNSAAGAENRSESESESQKNIETTPKISKEKAEGQHDDKPVH